MYSRIVIIEEATRKVGKCFGKDFDRVFFELMTEAKEKGLDLWYEGEEDFYRRKYDNQ